MIVPMKKVSLVLLSSRRRAALQRLRKAGVVHLLSDGGASEELEKLRDTQALLQRALAAFPAGKKAASARPPEGLAQARVKAEEICALADSLRQRRDEAEKLLRDIERAAPWGDYNPQTLRFLESRGLLLRLYELGKEQEKKLSPGGARFVVYRRKSMTGLVWVGRAEEDFPAGIEALPLPEKGLSRLKEDLAGKQAEIQAIRDELQTMRSWETSIIAAREEVAEKMEFEQAAADLGAAGPLAYLSGFVPEPKVEKLRETARAEGWGLMVRDPGEDEAVPTRVENPPAVGIIQPIFNFLGTVPGYREVDISFFFLVFFSFFFAMIIGDAAYGSLLLGVSVFFSLRERKKKGAVPQALTLFMLMGSGTIVWGALTGNWFGYEPISRAAPFSWFVVPALSSWDPRSSETVKFITFVIGTIHLSIAHIWNFAREIGKKPRIRAFTQLGWLSMVLGLYFVVLNMVLDARKYPVPDFARYMILGGFLAVLFLSQQEGNFFKGLVKGLGGFITTFLSSISAFSDIISYIRLFAVGLAGIEIAKSFNAMAQGLMTNPLGIVFGILVVVLGHGLNMAMSGLSVVVHGVRLNVLEFSNHLGLEWSGFSYDPFREKTRDDTETHSQGELS